jgi:ABC-type Fe3+ transport system permease subunit
LTLRLLAERLFFFTIPFGLYVGYLVARLVNPFEISRWTRRVLIPLCLAGLVLAVGSLLVSGFFSDQFAGAYRPAHIEQGRIVPGQGQ